MALDTQAVWWAKMGPANKKKFTTPAARAAAYASYKQSHAQPVQKAPGYNAEQYVTADPEWQSEMANATAERDMALANAGEDYNVGVQDAVMQEGEAEQNRLEGDRNVWGNVASRGVTRSGITAIGRNKVGAEFQSSLARIRAYRDQLANTKRRAETGAGHGFNSRLDPLRGQIGKRGMEEHQDLLSTWDRGGPERTPAPPKPKPTIGSFKQFNQGLGAKNAKLSPQKRQAAYNAIVKRQTRVK